MPLTVETGTGLSTADAYVSLVDFKAFCTDRGYSFAGYTDVQLEASIRLATGWIDTQARYKGTRLLATQALEWPRTDITDWSNFPVTGVPLRVRHACSELAHKGLSEALYADVARGGQIVSESVGPISVTYAQGAPPGKLWLFASNLLKPYLREALESIAPGYEAPATTAAFTLGMQDNPEAAGLTE